MKTGRVIYKTVAELMAMATLPRCVLEHEIRKLEIQFSLADRKIDPLLFHILESNLGRVYKYYIAEYGHHFHP